jgi:RNA polymerase sigma-70 factor (family 1)
MHDYSVFSDLQLMILIRQDDHIAFEALYKRHWPRMYQSAFSICHDRETCMDICQEIFIWFWEHRASANIINSVQGYLLAATKYKMISNIRKNKVKADFFTKAKALSETYTIEESMEVKELQAIILEFVNALPEKCGEIFKMSRNEHLSNKEIAGRLGVSEKTVENQMTIALRKLKRSLANLHCWFPLL